MTVYEELSFDSENILLVQIHLAIKIQMYYILCLAFPFLYTHIHAGKILDDKTLLHFAIK
jgi:hypothetical protein